MTRTEVEEKARAILNAGHWACVRLPTSRTSPVEPCDCDRGATDGCQARVKVITAALLEAVEGERARCAELAIEYDCELAGYSDAKFEEGYGVGVTDASIGISLWIKHEPKLDPAKLFVNSERHKDALAARRAEIAAAVEAERTACLGEALRRRSSDQNDFGHGYDQAASDIASAIASRRPA